MTNADHFRDQRPDVHGYLRRRRRKDHGRARRSAHQQSDATAGDLKAGELITATVNNGVAQNILIQ